jgi:glycosyltransferase involved in cell wall biosynthesis
LKPDILYSFLPEANLAGLIAGRLAKVPQIVWGIRSSNMDTSKCHWLFAVILYAGAWLSRLPDAIVFNSSSGLQHHKSIGYYNSLMTVIPNGIDTAKFKPDKMLGEKVRSQWGVDDEMIIIGLVGRLDPQKDHITFLRAARIFLDYSKDVRFVCVGDAQEPFKSKILNLGNRLGLNEHLIWNQVRMDIPAVYNAMDIVTSSSFGEGFSNVIGEAMACGVPCVVTDVGDSALVVGDTGLVVPINDPEALTDGWRCILKRLNENSTSTENKARARIMLNYNSEILIQKTTKVFLSLFI